MTASASAKPGDPSIGSPGFTATLDGLWAIQVVAGIERVCPELGLRPHDPRTETVQLAQSVPVFGELVEQGAVVETADGWHVDKPIFEWLTVLSRREVALIVLMQQPGESRDLPLRVALSRFGRWWVSMSLFDNHTVRIRPMGTARTNEDAASLIVRELENLCGTAEPASSFEPIVVASDRLLACRSVEAVQKMMLSEGASADQLRAGLTLSSADECATASIVALQQGQKLEPVVTDHFVTVADTADGRMVIKNVDRSGKRWTVLAPGAPRVIRSALSELLATLPAGEEWHNARNVFG